MTTYLEVALEAAKKAGAVLLRYFDQDIASKVKADLSPVTKADREAEAVIRETIAHYFPDHTFHGEEGSKVNLENHQGFTWIIDPLDGTKSFLRGNPLFATQIALLHNSELVLGVSNAPLLKECMYAEKGGGCFLNEATVTVSPVASIGEAYLSYGSLNYFQAGGSIPSLIQLSQSVKWTRGIGDFWSYHLLAQGKIEIMIEARTKLWDIAALKVIVEEAGGTFTQLDGEKVTFQTDSALATNGTVHPAVLKFFRNA